MFFEYNGKKLFFSLTGQGASTVVMLHGWGCTGDIFRSFLPSLESSHRVLTLDFPGFGQSEEPASVWGVEDYADCVEALLRQLEIETPHILGHSFGGRVGIVLASRIPAGRMILTDSAGIKPRHGAKYYLKVWSYKLCKFFILKVLGNEELFREFRKGKGSEDYRNASPMMKAILSKVVGEDLSALMPGIKIPVLLFWGENDTATPVKDAEKMEKLFPDCALITVKGGGHYSFLDDPLTFSRVMDNFFV